VTKGVNAVWITTEFFDVPFDPLQRHDHVLHAVVAREHSVISAEKPFTQESIGTRTKTSESKST
jgi:hypothetical protein